MIRLTKQEKEQLLKEWRHSGFTKEQLIKTQTDLCRITFDDALSSEEQYLMVNLSKASCDMKGRALLIFNQNLKMHIKQADVLEFMKEAISNGEL